MAGYARLDSFHTTHGRAIPFATGLKLANPELQVVVYSGDGDLFAIGGNHFIHAARRNMDLKVICVNNLTYAMTGGQTAPTTPSDVISATAPYGVFEPAFNLVQLADACGASYVARWTTFHVKQLARSMEEVLKKKGFGFIEIVSPCPTLYQRRNKMGDGLDTMKYYKQASKTRHGAPTAECSLTKSGEIVVGKFIDRERPDYYELLQAQMHETSATATPNRRCMLQRMLTEIRIAGFGGQGVILAAAVVGKANAIFEGGYATMTQSFGPEARGGSSSAQVHPLRRADPLPLHHPARRAGGHVAGSLHALRARIEARRNPDRRAGHGALRRCSRRHKVYGVPATRLAEELGRKVVLNIVMVGFLGAVTGMVEADALRKAVNDSVPPALRSSTCKPSTKASNTART